MYATSKLAAIDPKIAKNWYTLRPHAKQAAFATCVARGVRLFSAAAGRGSGKTTIALRTLAGCLMGKQTHLENNYFLCAPTRPQVKKIGFTPLLDLIPDMFIEDVNLTDLIITMKSGAVLYVAGTDQPQRIEGKQYVGGFLDECSDMKPKVFSKSIMPALSRYNGWCGRIGVTKRSGIGAEDFKKFFFETAHESYTWPSEDILTPEQIAEAKQQLSSLDYEEQYNASWESCVGGIFHAFGQHNITPIAYNSSKRIYVSSDYNVNPMCWVLCHKAPDGKGLHQFGEIWLRNTNTIATLDHLAARHGNHEAGFTFLGDASGKARKTSNTDASHSDIAHIRNDKRFAHKVVNYATGNPRVVDRFASCNALFRNAAGDVNYLIDPSCTHTIADLEAREYKDGTNEPNDKGDIGHITDALGYAIHRGWPIKYKVATATGNQVGIR